MHVLEIPYFMQVLNSAIPLFCIKSRENKINRIYWSWFHIVPICWTSKGNILKILVINTDINFLRLIRNLQDLAGYSDDIVPHATSIMFLTHLPVSPVLVRPKTLKPPDRISWDYDVDKICAFTKNLNLFIVHGSYAPFKVFIKYQTETDCHHHLKLLNRISQNYLATKDIPCRFIIILLLNICSLVGVTSLKLLKWFS